MLPSHIALQELLMRVFVTGASGHIGSAVVPELIKAGHEVTGLARSDASAAAVQALGAEVHRGDLGDPDGLGAAVAGYDAVIHLAFDHATMMAGDFPAATATDLAVVRALGDALAGTGKTLIGVGLAPTGDPERGARGGRGVRPILGGVPPVTHSDQDRIGFIPTMIGIARGTGESGYVDEGANHWPAVHTLDLAVLFRLALEQAPAGSQVFGAAEEGIPVREIAEAIARHLSLPAVSVPADQAADPFKGFPFVTMDIPRPPAPARELLGWEPTHPGLIADLDEGHYFAAG